MAVVFDTLKFANKLKAAGVPDKQAEAEAEALADVLEVNLGELVTKDYLDARLNEAVAGLDTRLNETAAKIGAELRLTEARLDVRITRLDADMTWLKRLGWAILGAAVVQLLKIFGVF